MAEGGCFCAGGISEARLVGGLSFTDPRLFALWIMPDKFYLLLGVMKKPPTASQRLCYRVNFVALEGATDVRFGSKTGIVG